MLKWALFLFLFLLFVWCPCIAINVRVPYNSIIVGFSPTLYSYSCLDTNPKEGQN